MEKLPEKSESACYVGRIMFLLEGKEETVSAQGLLNFSLQQELPLWCAGVFGLNGKSQIPITWF
jgi:hypothetical protein